ncbi:MAG: iron-sulfur cluster assembly protein [Candidatus Omnitrophota bacterium]|jgi:iron-sulfur cluster assembly protein
MSDQINKPEEIKDFKISLTPSAVKKVKLMMERDDKENAGLRVDVVTGGCAGMSYEMRFQNNPYDNDHIIKQDGLKMFINPQSAVFLNGIAIDYKDTLKESGFEYVNPNASSSCGCGTSFS